MIVACVLAVCGLMTVAILIVCWARYWHWIEQTKDLQVILAKHDPPAAPDSGWWDRVDRAHDKEDAWYTRYHWCLLIGPLFFAAATFAAFDNALADEPLLVLRLLPAILGASAMAFVGWALGYGPIREYVLPLEEKIHTKQE